MCLGRLRLRSSRKWANCKVPKIRLMGRKREKFWVGGKLKHLIKSTAASVNCRLCHWVYSSPPACASAVMPLGGKTMVFMCYHVCWMPRNAERNMSKKVGGLGEEVAPGQEHDTHYWLDYNEEQGNSSQWCLCIDEFKTQNNMYLSHTDTGSTNKQPPTSTFVQLN